MVCDGITGVPSPSTMFYTSSDNDFTIGCAAPGFVDCSGAAAFAVARCVSFYIETKCLSAGGGIIAGFSSFAVKGGGVNGQVYYTQLSCTWDGGSGVCATGDIAVGNGCKVVVSDATGYLRNPADSAVATAPPIEGPFVWAISDSCSAPNTVLGVINGQTSMDLRGAMLRELDAKTSRIVQESVHLPDFARGPFLVQMQRLHDDVKTQIEAFNEASFEQAA
jgi:hypothetical protein